MLKKSMGVDCITTIENRNKYLKYIKSYKKYYKNNRLKIIDYNTKYYYSHREERLKYKREKDNGGLDPRELMLVNLTKNIKCISYQD